MMYESPAYQAANVKENSATFDELALS